MHTKTDLLFTCCVFSNGTSLDEGSFMAEHWLQEERRLHLLEMTACGKGLFHNAHLQGQRWR